MARILVISPTPTHPQDAGNRARICSLLSGLKTLGHKVYLAFVKTENGDEEEMAKAWDEYFPIPYQRPTDRRLKQQIDTWSKKLSLSYVYPYRIDDWYTPEISRQLIEIRERVNPDVVMVEYVFLSRALDCFGPETLKIIDTHDIFGNRHQLYQRNNMAPLWFYTTTDQERIALNRAHIILAIQDEEADYFRQLTTRQVYTVGHIVRIAEAIVPADNEARRLLFVGSANPINVNALKWFLEKAFPLVRHHLPDIKFEVVGECANQITPTDGLVLTGRVADLTPHYHNATVVINPVRFGTGLKIKTLEALAHKRPLITTSAGATGLKEWEGKAFLIADSPAEFADTTQQVLSSKTMRSELAANAHEFIHHYNEAAFRPLINAIDRWRQK